MHQGVVRWFVAQFEYRSLRARDDDPARARTYLDAFQSIHMQQVTAKILSHLERSAPEQCQTELPLGARAPPMQSSLL
jgi:hypothetical protein